MAEVAQPLYARLRDALRGRILDGALAPGDQLPSEAELSAEHGVSRITVRQALGDLQKAGLIVRLQGKGAFVAPPHASQNLQRLEGLSEALAEQGQSVRSKRLSATEVRARGEVAAQLGVPAGTAVVQLASLRYLDGKPLSVSRSHFVPGLGERVARVDVSDRDLLEVLERDLAQPVREAQLEIRAMAMPARDAKWLRCEAGEPALHVHRLVLGAQGQPLHTEDAIYPAERFSYRLVLRR
ncbi:MAG TPA: GntR family transcriptional regulator [Ramlibacter sp.]|nr:GntR family transcriptional regulator [Ramlibacter sp.]